MFKSRIDENKPFIPLSIAVLAISDTRTLQTDDSGALLQSLMEEEGHACAERAIVRDDVAAIRDIIRRWSDNPGIDVIITTGGTGFSGRDVTPEAVEPLFDKRMEGFSVLFHQYSSQTIGTSSLQSRATAGLIGTTFVFCVPGSRGACKDAWVGILSQQLDHRHLPCNFVELIPRLSDRDTPPAPQGS